MFIVFFDAKSAIYKKFLLQGQTNRRYLLRGRFGKTKEKNYRRVKRHCRYLATASRQYAQPLISERS